MRSDNYLLKDSLLLLKPNYTKWYMAVITALVISIYGFGYIEAAL